MDSDIHAFQAVSANGRYFTDHAGNPVFFLGDTQWELFRLFSVPDARALLLARKAAGFNALLIMLTGINNAVDHPEAPELFANLEGQLPWHSDDVLRPNEA